MQDNCAILKLVVFGHSGVPKVDIWASRRSSAGERCPVCAWSSRVNIFGLRDAYGAFAGSILHVSTPSNSLAPRSYDTSKIMHFNKIILKPRTRPENVPKSVAFWHVFRTSTWSWLLWIRFGAGYVLPSGGPLRPLKLFSIGWMFLVTSEPILNQWAWFGACQRTISCREVALFFFGTKKK